MTQHIEPAAPVDKGELIELARSLGTTDMARMSPADWMAFLDAVVSGFQDKLAELHEPKA